MRQTWARGSRSGDAILTPTEEFNSIDVASCIAHSFSFPVGFGSGQYSVVGKTGDVCEVRLGGETEGGRHAATVCRFPTALGRVRYTIDQRGRFELGTAQVHCAK